MEYSEAENIEKCKKAIEDKLNWGSSALWLNYDFERLNEQIFAETNVQISVSTLKRIFGKASYHSSPSLTTLNTLAQFIGFTNWRGFTKSIVPQPTVSDAPVSPVIAPEPVVVTKNQRRYFIYGIISTLAIISLIAFMVQKEEPLLDSSKFAFKANKIVTEGVPNSVIFTYDATATNINDSVFIVQTWDMKRRKKVDRNAHNHSAIYYYPGFFRTKLIVNKQIVKEHDLQIKTANWLALVESKKEAQMPLYFAKPEVLKGDEISIDRDLLKKYNLSLQPEAPKIRFFNQTDLGELMNDNFTFETFLKNDFSDGTGACQKVQVLIQCKDDIIIIPLCAKACVGNINLVACGTVLTSADADLSGFGCDLNQWTKLRVETRNKQMTFFVNDKKAHTLTFDHNSTGIVGLQYRFEGTGAVKDTWIEGAGGKHEFVMK
ncbi:hypothetical protein [Emticicia agri]|uniref:Helix-turn-helix domain-containing protein n=1 Tax=Emticicia agri TaxID=2492393 RepID=A0A4Q5M4X4_9BACT|nr:hypothetical protein [Emticicia agri]RYU97454.1 hypothetical protein EWM59_01835 [Emticicia agri]